MILPTTTAILLLSFLPFSSSSLSSSSPSSPLSCRPPGPLLPRPRNMTSHPSFQDAISRLADSLDAATTSHHQTINPGFSVQNTSFSIGVVVWDDDGEQGKGIPAWEYHHLAPGNVQGTERISRDSEYLIGSLSKVFTDYMLLGSGVDLDDPGVLGGLIPELLVDRGEKRQEGGKGGGVGIRWDEITLRMLGGHMAGIPPNYGFSEYFYLSPYFESLGFPPIPNSSYPPCGVTGLNKGCTREEFLSGLTSSSSLEPIAPPETRPVYSNIAFTLISYALSSFFGGKEGYNKYEDYPSLLDSLVIKPLNLSHHTQVSDGSSQQANSTSAVIPPTENSWGSDYGDGAPGGGLISSLSDLTRFFGSILDRSAFGGEGSEKETKVRKWLRPDMGHTGSVRGGYVGMPWEVYRADSEVLMPGKGGSGKGRRTIDIYGKGGGAYGYASQVGLVDELGFGIIVLTAGGKGTEAVQPLYDTVLREMVEGVDGVARAQAEKGYLGVWEGEGEGEGEEKVRARFGMDEGGAVVLEGLERGGKDILEGYKEIWSVSVGQFMASRLEVARMFPVEGAVMEEWKVEGGEGEMVREEWRIDWQMDWTGDSELPGAGAESVSRDNCLGWTLTDWIHYGSEALDKIVFIKGKESGEVLGLEVPFLRSGVLTKVQGA